jgi:predicted nuclease with TOPRIM domain
MIEVTDISQLDEVQELKDENSQLKDVVAELERQTIAYIDAMEDLKRELDELSDALKHIESIASKLT